MCVVVHQRTCGPRCVWLCTNACAAPQDLERLLSATQERLQQQAETIQVAQRRVRELEDDGDKRSKANSEAQSGLEARCTELEREVATGRQQVRRAQEREEELQQQVVAERTERVSLERAMRSISDRMKATKETQSATEQKADALSRVGSLAAARAAVCVLLFEV